MSARTKGSRRTAQKRRREPSTPATEAGHGRTRRREVSPAVPTPIVLPRRLAAERGETRDENAEPARPREESTPLQLSLMGPPALREPPSPHLRDEDYLNTEGFVSSASQTRQDRGATTQEERNGEEDMEIDELLPSSPTPEPARLPLNPIATPQSTLAARTGCSQYAYTANQPHPPRPTALRLDHPAVRTRLPRERGRYLHAVSPTRDVFSDAP